jgi:hypothetical protein
LRIARDFGAKIVANELVTGEAGKAAALRHATGGLVALVDSDNIVVGKDWLRRMVRPFDDPSVVGAEPLRFVAEKSDTVIDRYCAIAGANDPFCLFAGVYDRCSAITGRWTGLDVRTDDRDGYVVFSLNQPLPTIGANGTIYRRDVIEPLVGDYLVDIDLPSVIAEKMPEARFAKVDVGIRHLFCSDSRTFARKQTRRIRDYFSKDKRGEQRAYPWQQIAGRAIVPFVASCLTVAPLLSQSLRAYARTRDRAAFYHPVACWITLGVYAFNFMFAHGREMSRAGWKQ